MNDWVKCTGIDIFKRPVTYLNLGNATWISKTQLGSLVTFIDDTQLSVDELPETLVARMRQGD